MNVDPQEIAALNEAADFFERHWVEFGCTESEPFVNLMQAIRRFARIAEVAKKPTVLVPSYALTEITPAHIVQRATILGFEGTPCVKCGEFKMRRFGTCLTCCSCGESTGC